jgi:filamentous hemagglutinin
MFQLYLGFSKDNYEPLLEQILAQVLEAEVILQRTDEYGQRYQVDLEIRGVEEGQREIVRTGWIVEPGSDAARLVTLYVRKRQ